MDPETREHLQAVRSADMNAQNAAFTALMTATQQPVDWAYEAWDDLIACLSDKDNRARAIASQVLCNLAAYSDPDGRMLDDFPTLLNVTHDERFVTARHCLQAIWKVGLAAPAQQAMVISGLSDRYREADVEKNGKLIRYDIQVDLRQLYDETHDETIRAEAQALIELESDAKYRKKYAGAWKAA